jgi:hypothetical protein
VFITGFTSTVQNGLRVYGLGMQKTDLHSQAGIETGTDFPQKKTIVNKKKDHHGGY